MKQEIADVASAATKAAVDSGLLIEAGFLGLVEMAYPGPLSPVQHEEMRNCFFAGAHHVFASIVNMTDDGSGEATEDDMRRMNMIESELQAFLIAFKARLGISDDIIPPQPPVVG